MAANIVHGTKFKGLSKPRADSNGAKIPAIRRQNSANAAMAG
jgi:hypothetical protein